MASVEISSFTGVDLFTAFIILGLVGPVVIVHIAAFRANKFGLFGVYSKFRDVSISSLTEAEKTALCSMILLFFSTCLSLAIS